MLVVGLDAGATLMFPWAIFPILPQGLMGHFPSQLNFAFLLGVIFGLTSANLRHSVSNRQQDDRPSERNLNPDGNSPRFFEKSDWKRPIETYRVDHDWRKVEVLKSRWSFSGPVAYNTQKQGSFEDPREWSKRKYKHLGFKIRFLSDRSRVEQET